MMWYIIIVFLTEKKTMFAECMQLWNRLRLLPNNTKYEDIYFGLLWGYKLFIFCAIFAKRENLHKT